MDTAFSKSRFCIFFVLSILLAWGHSRKVTLDFDGDIESHGFYFNHLARRPDEAVYYRNCSSVFPSPGRIKCVGYPVDCITKQNCVWMVNVIDDGERLTSTILHKIVSNGDGSTLMLDGMTFQPLDESMTKTVCRQSQIEDVKFFFFSNDTQLIKKIDASKNSTSYFTSSTKKNKDLENCTEIDIPTSKNPKHDFNLRYFIANFSSVRLSLEYVKMQYEAIDSIEYIIDPTKMLYHTQFEEVSSSVSIYTLTIELIITTCIITKAFAM